MAKTATPTKKRQRAKSGLLTRVLILILLVGICAQLYTLRGQVERAQTDQELLAAQIRLNERETENAPSSVLRLWRSFLGWVLALLF